MQKFRNTGKSGNNEDGRQEENFRIVFVQEWLQFFKMSDSEDLYFAERNQYKVHKNIDNEAVFIMKFYKIV